MKTGRFLQEMPRFRVETQPFLTPKSAIYRAVWVAVWNGRFYRSL